MYYTLGKMWKSRKSYTGIDFFGSVASEKMSVGLLILCGRIVESPYGIRSALFFGFKSRFLCGNCGIRHMRHGCGKLCGKREKTAIIFCSKSLCTACRNCFAQFRFSKQDKDFSQILLSVVHAFSTNLREKICVVVKLWKTLFKSHLIKTIFVECRVEM